jgi:hypothetical protein
MTSLDIALDFLDLNPDCYIFPIKAKKKTPPLIKDNLNAASNDTDQIKVWSAKWPNCSWGLALKKSKRLVVDIDRRPGNVGQDTYNMHDLEYGWPETMRVKTPSGGYHLHYAGEHVFALGKDGFGLDIDSPNYVLLPGCELEDGTKYEEEGAMQVVPAPQWFYDLLGAPRERDANETALAVVDLDQAHNVEWAIHYLKNDAPPAIEGQGGESTTLKVAMTLRDHGISEERALELMSDHYNILGICDPLWDIDGDHGLAKKVANAYAYANLKAPGASTAEADFADSPYIGTLPELKPAVAEVIADDKKARDKVKGRKPEKRYTPAMLADEWVYIAQQEQFVRRKDSFTLSTKAFNARYAYTTKQGPISTKLLKSNANSIRKFDSYCYEPGSGELECASYNLYRPGAIVPTAGDTSTWNEHLAFLFPDEADRAHVLNWLAWVYQNPGKKPKHMLIIQGEQQGTGKSFIGDVFGAILGHHNVTQLRDEITKSSFNGWAKHTKLIVIEEVRQAGRNDVARALHDMITQEWITINEKNVPHFRMRDYIAWLGFTNRDDAMSMDDSDRRYLVVRTPAERKDTGYYVDLYATLEDKAALAAIAAQLGSRDLGAYNGQARAPLTNAKQDMIEAGHGDLETWFKDNLGVPPLSWKLVTVGDVIANLPTYVTRGNGGIRLQKRIMECLKRFAKGQTWPDQCRLSNGEKVRLWALSGSFSILNNVDPRERAKVYEAQRDRSKAQEVTAAVDDFGNEAE